MTSPKRQIPNQEKYNKSIPLQSSQGQKPIKKLKTGELLSVIKEGREFESIISFFSAQKDFTVTFELREQLLPSILAIQAIRKKPVICYIANVINSNILGKKGIDETDDLPFAEMVNCIPDDIKEIDIILVTGGGSGVQIGKFVDKLRPRFDKVSFILPNIAMSAGTIFVMSGDEIIMDSRAYIGPTDPQVINKDGQYVPAQALLTLIDDMQKRGEIKIKAGQSPDWTDLQILNKLDAKELGAAKSGSNYSIKLVTDFLYRYKFRSWTTRKSSGIPVTDKYKHERATEISETLCNHSYWNNHATGISREEAEKVCKLEIVHLESISGLEKEIRSFWALVYWFCENQPILKMYISEHYAVIKNAGKNNIIR